jgi:hypothetical protein
MTKKGIVMKQRFILFRRAGVFYYEDTTTGKQLSLRTKDEAEALTFLACWRGWSRRINARPVVASKPCNNRLRLTGPPDGLDQFPRQIVIPFLFPPLTVEFAFQAIRDPTVSP